MSNRDFRDQSAPDRFTSRLTSRRTVAKGMAWTVPVIAVASAAPAFAASCETFTFGPNSCKCPGRSTNDAFGYYLTICYTCPTGTTGGEITINSVNKANGTPLTQVRKNGACGPLLATTLELNGCTEPLYFTGTNSANFLIINYTVDGQTSDFKIPAPPDCAAGKCNAPDEDCPTT